MHNKINKEIMNNTNKKYCMKKKIKMTYEKCGNNTKK